MIIDSQYLSQKQNDKRIFHFHSMQNWAFISCTLIRTPFWNCFYLFWCLLLPCDFDILQTTNSIHKHLTGIYRGILQLVEQFQPWCELMEYSNRILFDLACFTYLDFDPIRNRILCSYWGGIFWCIGCNRWGLELLSEPWILNSYSFRIMEWENQVIPFLLSRIYCLRM